MDDMYSAILFLVCHRESLLGSSNECSLTPVGCQPSDQASRLGP